MRTEAPRPSWVEDSASPVMLQWNNPSVRGWPRGRGRSFGGRGGPGGRGRPGRPMRGRFQRARQWY
jgi:hypothetical protein